MSRYLYKLKATGEKTQTFDGFKRWKMNSVCKTMGVVSEQGEIDLWELDDDNIELALSELARFYRMQNGGATPVIRVFKHEKVYLS